MADEPLSTDQDVTRNSANTERLEAQVVELTAALDTLRIQVAQLQSASIETAEIATFGAQTGGVSAVPTELRTFEPRRLTDDVDSRSALGFDRAADYLGEAADEGMLRAGATWIQKVVDIANNTITYTHIGPSSGTPVTGAGSPSYPQQVIATLSYDAKGHVTAATAVTLPDPDGGDYLPEGSNNQMLINISGAWNLLAAPSGPSVLCYDVSGGVRWLALAYDKQGVYRDGLTVISDYVRFVG